MDTDKANSFVREDEKRRVLENKTAGHQKKEASYEDSFITDIYHCPCLDC